jgi:hypothetical protein
MVLLALLAVLAAAMLGAAVSALAATPKRGAHFTGRTSANPVNGFHAPVTFAVSGKGTTLQAFTYSTFGCFGAGGFRPGIDYYTQPGSLIKVGAIKVSRSGRFSVSGAVWSDSVAGQKTTTTSAVTGRFTSAKAASGTITFSQKLTGEYTSSCGPGTIHFTATSR